MINFLRFQMWPAVKTRVIYWWWIIKYRGKKNIPPQVIFGAMEKTMNGLKDNLMQAFRALPSDVDEEEKKEFFEIFGKVKELEKEIKNKDKQ